ncbi:MAG: hypothetical protein CMP91_03620 [Gammaproteobacteria bacterium]|nr:hypothetical protein [Gammaproteobacteria bacterium]|tara:strand:- start:184165 stop:186879 length:2715 start_codon:yes stop_codon:yes gene_type:complete
MGSKGEQTLWVSSVNPEKIDGNSYVPTCLLYQDNGEYLTGRKALLNKRNGILNNNFKVELGEVVPGGSFTNRKKFNTNDGKERTAFELSNDYFSSILKNFEESMAKNESGKLPARIIVAEPLSFQVEGSSNNWLGNYRDNIRRILSNYEEVEFLPEPFAVYQYYRYGQKIPHLQDKTKNVAFVIDFGGGTFDACVIESTHLGDISQSGKNSKPLSADSVPVGGYVINNEIAKYLIIRDLDVVQKKKIGKYIDQYERVKKGDLDPEVLRDEAQIFIKNLDRLSDEIENIKIELVSKIVNWSLDGDHYEKVIVEKPINPLELDNLHKSEFYAHQLKTIYEKNIWDAKLKRVIKNVLDRCEEALDGKKINITLISGGSANIKWLEKLLIRDFEDQLSGAEPVPISHSFQEIVANGLAIECARRFYSPNSEFVAVTYNPVKLYLDPDGAGVGSSKRYKSIGDKIDMSAANDYDLIPVAQSLKHFFNESLQWRVNLSKFPRNYLDYYFSRPDKEDYKDCYNVESTRVNTSDNSRTDKHTKVELVVREDGTAIPKFIYQSPNAEHGIPENSEIGRPFYLDMTTNSQSVGDSSNYIGFDFGTSNSSICVLSNEKIQLTTHRQNDKSWINLSSALNDLPYPVAISLRAYLQSRAEPVDSCSKARECFEACMAFMAYLAIAELSIHKDISGIFKHYQHRSMGPLKTLLVESLKKLGAQSKFTTGFKSIISDKQLTKLNKAINDFTEHKHDKKEINFDYHGHLDFIISILYTSMQDLYFGSVASIEPQDFSQYGFKGQFIIAHDVAPFSENFGFQSNEPISSNEAILLIKETGEYLGLLPLIFWWNSENTASGKSCFFFDRPKSSKSEALVKLCGAQKAIEAISLHEGLGVLIEKIASGDLKSFKSGHILMTKS